MNAHAVRQRETSQRVAEKITAAAIDVFARQGWAGFTLESVGRAAGVGKSSIYRRFRTREALMVSIIESHLFDGGGINTGDFETDLRLLVRGYAEWLDGPGGRLSLRLFVEDRLNDDFRTLWVDNLSRESAVDSLFGIIERGKARGDVDVTVPTAVVLHSVLGGVVQQLAASTAQTGTVFTSAEGLAYLDALVDSVLRASRPQTERRREG